MHVSVSALERHYLYSFTTNSDCSCAGESGNVLNSVVLFCPSLQAVWSRLVLLNPTCGSVSSWAPTPPWCCSTRFSSSALNILVTEPWNSTRGFPSPASRAVLDPAAEQAKSTTSSTEAAALRHTDRRQVPTTKSDVFLRQSSSYSAFFCFQNT